MAEARNALESVGVLGLTDAQVRLWDVLGQQLIRVLDQYKQGDPTWAASLVDADAATEDHKLLLELRADPQDLKDQKLTELVQELGLELLAEIDAYSCEVLIPIDKLESVANDPRIAAIRRITRPEATGGGTPSYPDADLTGVTNASWWQDNGVRGEGVTVVIVDNFLPAPADRPASEVITPRPAARLLARIVSRLFGSPISRPAPPPQTHGWRMEDQIRRLAPRANIVRIETGTSTGSALAALSAASRYPNAIVNLSAGIPIDRPSVPGESMSPLQRALDNVRPSGVVVASAGNGGLNHWSGNFSCSNQPLSDASFAPPGSCWLNWGQFSPVAGYPYVPNAGGELLLPELGVYVKGFGSDHAVNVIGCFANSYPRQPPSQLPSYLAAHIGFSSDNARNFTPVLMRKVSGAWAPVRVSTEGLLSKVSVAIYANEERPAPIATWRIPALPAEPTCEVGDLYGIALMRRGPAPAGDSTYVNMFVAPYETQVSTVTSIAAVDESNALPGLLTVSGTLCDGTRGMCSSVGLPFFGYSFGPAVLRGRQPTFVRDGTGPRRRTDGVAIAPELSRIARDRDRGGEVKPDFIVPTALYGGTSQAAAVTSGLLALLRQRYPTLNNFELISAARRIAERRRSNYPTYTDPRTLLIEGLTTTTYGRGVFTLEKEAGVALRGQLNNVRLNAFITSSPSGAPPNGSMAYANTFPSSESQLAEPHWGWGFGPYPTLYFSSVAFTSTRASSFEGECARFSDRVRFPVLTPYVRFDAHLSAPAGGARVEDFDGGGVSTQWCPQVLPPSVSGAPFLASTGIFSDARMAPRTGAFEFNRMRITRMPTLPSGAPASVALNYGLVLASKRPDGQVVHSDDVPEHTLEIDLCDNASSDPRCPAIATR